MKHRVGGPKKARAQVSSAPKGLKLPEKDLFSKIPDWVCGLVLVLAVVFAYQPVWHAGYIWDDDSYVTGNATLHSLNGLGKIWFEPGATAQFYPLTFTTFWLEYHLWGLNATGYHLVNILLHALAAILLWKVLIRLNLPGAWLAAGIFALHPVQVESAAWITERKNVLSTVCYFAAALAYLRFFEAQDLGKTNRRWNDYFLALVLFIAGLLSKTVICSLPAALLLVRWWKKGQLKWKDIYPLLPFFVVGAGLSFLTAWMEKHHVGAEGADWSLTLGQRVLIAGRALWFYADKLIWPVDLIFNYPRWEIETGVWWQWLFPVAAIFAVIVLWLMRHRMGRGPLAAILFFAGTLVPALGFINVYPMRYSFVADHFQYLAATGLMALFAAGMVIALQKLPFFKTVIGLALLLTLAALTWRQCRMYHDEETLWRVTLQKNPQSWMAEDNLSLILLGKGEYDEAIAREQKALALNPNNETAYDNLGFALFQEGRVAEAAADYKKALAINPRNADAYNGLGHALMESLQIDDAIELYRKALEINPDYVEALNNLGNALMEKKQPEDAVVILQKAVAVNPDVAMIHYNLGRALIGARQIKPAISEFQRATELQPDFIVAFSRWSWILSAAPDASLRDGPKALELAQRANQLSRGENPSVLSVLAAAFAECKQFDEAIAVAQKALQLANAQNNQPLASLLQTQIKLYQSGSPLRDEALR